MRRFLSAVVQLCSTEDIEQNINTAVSQIRRAASAGARLIAIPENTFFLRTNPGTPQPMIETSDPIVEAMCSLADELSVDLVLGSIPEKSGVDGKVYNTSIYIDSNGAILATYRKMHLFDIDIPGSITLKESDHIVAGQEPCIVDSQLGRIGLTICYDLRFPEQYRELRHLGADIILCPAAFTLHTGKDHWLPLLRARAIENQVYVLAPGQSGHHGGKRHSYGKSTIISPWGITLATAADGVGIALAEIDLAQMEAIRQGLPCAEHRHARFWPEAK